MGPFLSQAIERKDRALRAIVRELPAVAVAFSGGLDSTYLLAVCVDELGSEHVLALTASSPLLPKGEMEEAQAIAREIGARHRVLPLDELSVAQVAANSPQRCYHCKRVRFEALLPLAQEANAILLHGENADDAQDYRPGAIAARELGVRAPLAEVGLTKAEIRILAKARGLSNWDKPASPCLATRFPYGTPLSIAGLRRIDRAEACLRKVLGVRQLRVRDHFPLARIEVPAAYIGDVVGKYRQEATRCLRELGYAYVTIDLEGYRMGSMNERIK